MKRAEFYSLYRENGKIIAKLWGGWTDGEYNYYRNKEGAWVCIHPEVGLQVTVGETRVIARRNADSLSDAIQNKKSLPEWEKQERRFRKQIERASNYSDASAPKEV